MAARTVVFDMDGTLVQTRAASWEVFQVTARQFGLPVTSAEEFFELFRENFYESLAAICGDPTTEAAVREHFLVGLRERYNPDFIPGMRDVVKALAARYPLAVMSSNAMSAIRRILEVEGLAQCFAHVFSGEVGASKQVLLQQIIDEPSYGNARHCSPSYVERTAGEPPREPDSAEVVIVTDTVGDVREARACGARAIGVAWGMHGSDELLAAGAEAVVLWPQELLAILLPEAPLQSATELACSCAVPGACSTSAGPATAAVPAPSPAWARATASGETRRGRRVAAVAAPPRPAVVGSRSGTPDLALAAALRRIAPPVHARPTVRPSTDSRLPSGDGRRIEQRSIEQ